MVPIPAPRCTGTRGQNGEVAERQPARTPFRVNWLRNGAGAGILANLAAGRLAATREALGADLLASPEKPGRG